MEFKEFRSANGDLYLSSTSGHMAVISTEFTPIPDVLWADAYIKGAIPADVKEDSTDDFIKGKVEEQRIKDLLEREELKITLKTIFDNPVGFLDSRNNLITRKVVAVLGKPVKKDLIDEIWAEVVAESEV